MCVCVCVCVCVFAHARSVAVLSHAQLFATLWTVALQAPLSMELSRQEYWDGLSFPLPRVLPNPGIKTVSPSSPVLPADSLPSEPSGKPMFYIRWHRKSLSSVQSFSRVRLFATP